jgi:hypothetical protein
MMMGAVLKFAASLLLMCLLGSEVSAQAMTIRSSDTKAAGGPGPDLSLTLRMLHTVLAIRANTSRVAQIVLSANGTVLKHCSAPASECATVWLRRDMKVGENEIKAEARDASGTSAISTWVDRPQ